MSTPATIVTGILVLGICVGNLAFWWWVMRHGESRFRERCERRYGVTIGRGMKGHWQVSGPRGWWSRLGIEMLQLAYFMGAMLLWSIAMIAAVGLLALVERFL